MPHSTYATRPPTNVVAISADGSCSKRRRTCSAWISRTWRSSPDRRGTGMVAARPPGCERLPQFPGARQPPATHHLLPCRGIRCCGVRSFWICKVRTVLEQIYHGAPAANEMDFSNSQGTKTAQTRSPCAISATSARNVSLSGSRYRARFDEKKARSDVRPDGISAPPLLEANRRALGTQQRWPGRHPCCTHRPRCGERRAAAARARPADRRRARRPRHRLEPQRPPGAHDGRMGHHEQLRERAASARPARARASPTSPRASTSPACPPTRTSSCASRSRTSTASAAQQRAASLGHFRTAPQQPPRRPLSVVRRHRRPGLGHQPGLRRHEDLRSDAPAQPDFFIHCGDTIYADGADLPKVDAGRRHDLEQPHHAGQEQGRRDAGRVPRQLPYNLLDDNVRRFNAEVPQIWQWDDHEVLNNWSPGKDLSADARYTEKSIQLLVARAQRAFLEYAPMRWHVSAESRAHLPHIPLRPAARRVRARHAQLPRPPTRFNRQTARRAPTPSISGARSSSG